MQNPIQNPMQNPPNNPNINPGQGMGFFEAGFTDIDLDMTEPFDVPRSHISGATIEELLANSERGDLKKLHPKKRNGALWFGVDSQVAGTVTAIFRRKFTDAYTSFTKTPTPVVDMWFSYFAQTYNWSAAINGKVRKEFDTALKKRLTDHTYRLKRKWKHGEPRPAYISDEVWAKFISHWGSDKHQSGSAKGQNARKSSGVHYSGQSSFSARGLKLAKDNNQSEVDLLATLEVTKRKGQTWADERSEKLHNDAMIAISQEQEKRTFLDPSAPPLTQFEKNQIFSQVAPKNKSNRIFGVGSLQNEAADALANIRPSSQEDDENASLRAKVAEQEDTIKAMLGFLKSKYSDFDESIRSFTSTQPGSSSNPPGSSSSNPFGNN